MALINSLLKLPSVSLSGYSENLRGGEYRKVFSILFALPSNSFFVCWENVVLDTLTLVCLTLLSFLVLVYGQKTDLFFPLIVDIF